MCLSLTHSGGSSAYLFILSKKCLSILSSKEKKAQRHFRIELSDTDVLFGDTSECQTAGNNGDDRFGISCVTQHTPGFNASECLGCWQPHRPICCETRHLC